VTVARGTSGPGYSSAPGMGLGLRGHAAVEAGGGLQAPIGFGYCLGPLLGLLAQALTHR